MTSDYSVGKHLLQRIVWVLVDTLLGSYVARWLNALCFYFLVSCWHSPRLKAGDSWATRTNARCMSPKLSRSARPLFVQYFYRNVVSYYQLLVLWYLSQRLCLCRATPICILTAWWTHLSLHRQCSLQGCGSSSYSESATALRLSLGSHSATTVESLCRKSVLMRLIWSK